MGSHDSKKYWGYVIVMDCCCIPLNACYSSKGKKKWLQIFQSSSLVNCGIFWVMWSWPTSIIKWRTWPDRKMIMHWKTINSDILNCCCNMFQFWWNYITYFFLSYLWNFELHMYVIMTHFISEQAYLRAQIENALSKNSSEFTLLQSDSRIYIQ